MTITLTRHELDLVMNALRMDACDNEDTASELELSQNPDDQQLAIECRQLVRQKRTLADRFEHNCSSA